MKTRRQIEASRERRLWFTQVIMPTITMALAALAIPEVRYAVKDKYDKAKQWAKDRFKK